MQQRLQPESKQNTEQSAPVLSGASDVHGDGYCGCTERCKDRDNCQYDVKPTPAETDAVAPENIGLPGGIKEAAQAVIDRWDTPNWKDAPATAVVINRLRAAISALPVESVQPSIAEGGHKPEQSGQKLSPASTKKTYIKPLRTIVEIDARYADKIRDLLNGGGKP